MLRASDSEREQVAELLRQATVEGRLSPEEFEGRLSALFSSRTYGELDALVADLPRAREQRPNRLWWLRPALAVSLAIAIAFLVLVTVVLILTGVFATGLVWMALAWFLMGRGRPLCAGRGHRGHLRAGARSARGGSVWL